MQSRLTYRARQFWNALHSPRRGVPDSTVLPYLSPTQVALFRRLQPSEQVHAFRIFEQLRSSGQRNPHLLAAALLHDVGKVLCPLSPLERVMIVLGKRLFPEAACRWGEGRPAGLRRAFVVAAQHAEWGAQLAEQAGASARTVELIRRHQDVIIPADGKRFDRLLAELQAADNEN